MQKQRDSTHLISPMADFLMVGGGFMLLMFSYQIYIQFFEPVDISKLTASYLIAPLVLGHFINNPHFAHSYQIFYQNFRQKISREYTLNMRIRYVIAGIIAPAAIIAFFAYCLIFERYDVLGYGASLMFFLVGWHYVKQGYGILIVLSVKKKVYFSNILKKTLLINAYAIWLGTWMAGNIYIKEDGYLGFKYETFSFPAELVVMITVVAIVTSTMSIYHIIKMYLKERKLPSLNGMVAYVTVVYMLLISSIINESSLVFAIYIPLFHSLQYLPFVYRYKYNEYKHQDAVEHVAQSPLTCMVVFMMFGFILGFMGFFFLPAMIGAISSFDDTMLGIGVLIFMWWIFINVHHYFLDNTMWRKENPDISKHLF